MATSYVTIGSKFRPYSFEEYIQPLNMYKQAYEEVESGITDLTTKAGAWENLANEQTDPKAYQMYKKYSEDLKNQADILASEGLTQASRQNLLRMKGRYSQEITPIEQAYTRRRQLADEQRKTLAENPTLMYQRDASTMSLDDFITNPEIDYGASYSGALLAKQAGDMASNLAKSMRTDPRKWEYILGGQYWQTMEKSGYTPEEIILASQFNENAPKELRDIMNQVYDSSGIDSWADNRTKERAMGYITNGLYNAIGTTKYETLQDRAFLTPYERWKMREEETPIPEQPSQYRTSREVFNSEGYGKVIDDILATKSFASPITVNIGGRDISVNNPMQATILSRGNRNQIKAIEDDAAKTLKIDISKFTDKVGSTVGPDVVGHISDPRYTYSTEYLKNRNGEYVVNILMLDKNTGRVISRDYNKELTDKFKSLATNYIQAKQVEDSYKQSGISDKALTDREEAKLREKYSIPSNVPIDEFIRYIDIPEVHSYQRDLPYVATPGDEGKQYREALAAQLSDSFTSINNGNKASLNKLKIKGGEGENIYKLSKSSSRREGTVTRVSDAFDFDDNGNITNIKSVLAIPESLLKGYIAVNTTKGRFEVPLQYFGNLFDSFENPVQGSPYTLRQIMESQIANYDYAGADETAMLLANMAFPMVGNNFFQFQPGTLNPKSK